MKKNLKFFLASFHFGTYRIVLFKFSILYGFFLIFTFIHLLSVWNSSVAAGLPLCFGCGCFLGAGCSLPFCRQYHHLHIHPSSFTEAIFSLLSSASFIRPSSCFHCSYWAALLYTKVWATLSHICHRGLAIGFAVPLLVVDDINLYCFRF